MRLADDAEPRAVRGGEASPGEEVLDVGRRRRAPRWFWVVAGVAAAVLVASVAIERGLSHHHGTSPTPSAGRAVAIVPPPVRPAYGPALDVGTGVVLDAVAFGQHTWVLHPDRIIGLSIAAGRPKAVALPPLGSSVSTGSWRLVRDVTTSRLWAVVEGTRHGRAIEYDLWTLTRMRDLRLPPIGGAAAMNGHLYLTSGNRFIDVPPRGAPHAIPVPGQSGAALGPVTADPARSRVIVLDYGARTHIWTYRPGREQARKTAVVPVTKSSIAVTEDAVWVGGYRSGSGSNAVLWQLDVPSLTPTGISPVGSELGPGARLLAGGTHDVWVASGGGPGLWCVDGRTGTEEQHWTFGASAVTTDHQRVIAVTDGRAVPLELRGGCTG